MCGHLTVLKWLRANGCPWDRETYKFALQDGDPELIRYVNDQGCPPPLFDDFDY
jgi:hypothetical protein